MRGQRGYTLIEVVVAFAVLALALTLLLGTLSGAARQIRGADDAGRAALHAQSLLATLGTDIALRPGRRDGDFEQGRYRWQLAIVSYAESGAPPAPGAARLLQLDLQVRWGEQAGQALHWRSLRLAAADATAEAVP
ncbi:type II secretion system protein XpsI [Xanthomonas massiliensis]|uniref:type II secretion system protein XpsI n=1 Tax=Xanthomonas massiliensis TaxID=1720302 RepID=UPI0008257307|nr:prepilin-type N-terminal cleavage/methylation domain-containing protein [Xanthomonas massiliensis]